MQIKEVIALLEQWAPGSYAEDFDNTGLLVGNHSATVSGILVSLAAKKLESETKPGFEAMNKKLKELAEQLNTGNGEN